MVEAFLLREQTDAARLPSFMFRMKTSFIEAQQYEQDLLNDLLAQSKEEPNQEALQEANIDLGLFERYEKNRNKPQSWMHLLSDFADTLKDMAGHMVVYLCPEELHDKEAWVNWIMSTLEYGVPSSVKIMLADMEGYEVFDSIVFFHKDKMETLQPHLNMREAILDIAAAKGQNKGNDPGIQYRQAFVQLLQHSQKGKLGDAKHFARQAQQIAQENKWPHLEVAALFGLASSMLNNQAFEEAYPVYVESREAAQKAEKEDLALGKRLAAQAYMGEGAVAIAAKDYDIAIRSYAAGAPIATEIDDHLLALESWRMAGYSAEQAKLWHQAWDYYQMALTSGQKLPNDQAENTTLPFAGKALIEIAGRSGHGNKEVREVIAYMEKLYGTEWEKKLNIEKVS